MIRECPNCGAEVPARAKACPECGSCEETGWSERAELDGPGIPDDEFSYDEFVQREFGSQRHVTRGISPFWWVVAILVFAAFLYTLLHH